MELRKAFRIKEVGDKGMVTAVIATLNVIDKDGDVILPGFFGKQEVVMLPAHDRHSIALGKGTLEEVDDEAIAQIQMNLGIQKAKDWHSALKFDLDNGKPLQEWSFGFRTFEDGVSQGEMQDQRVQFLGPRPDGSPGAKVDEVSPVLVGAGENTRTVEVKENTFLGEASKVLAAVDTFATRVKSLAELRAKQGRCLSAANMEKLKDMKARLTCLMTAFDGFLENDPEKLREDMRKIYLSRLSGSTRGQHDA